MELKIIAKGDEEKAFKQIIEKLEKEGFKLERKAGGIMPNYSGYYASLISERQEITKYSEQHDSKALHIADVSGSYTADEVVDELEQCETIDDAIMFFKQNWIE
jgi:organic radical activating enzyme